MVTPQVKRKAKQTPTRSIPRPTTPHEWGGIGLTKGMVAGCGWVYMVLVLAWYTDQVVGD